MPGVAVRTAGPSGHDPDPSIGDLVAAWLPGQRWFPGGGSAVQVEPWLSVTFEDVRSDDASSDAGTSVDGASVDGADADVVLMLVRVTGDALPGGSVVVQVPLVLLPGDERGPGFIDVVHAASGDVAVHDGGVHPACWLALLRAVGVGADVDDDTLVARGRAIAGEQSNTSVVLPGVPSPSGAGGMLKILRTVTPGPHPDVVVPQALTRAGWLGVPRYLGSLEIAAPVDPIETDVLAVLAELVPDAADGFELACDHASRGESFAHLAAALGRVVAELHTVLRQAMPPGPRLDPATFVAGLRRRAETAVAAAPSLVPRAAAIDVLLDDLEGRLPPLRLQTIHGDLHLGQALHGASGWKLLDFEGEPQRPVAERTAPDLPLRDVAGMVRSFDYAAAVGGATDPGWQAETSHAFLGAYRRHAETPGMDPPTADAVLRALVLDKALYEVVYETRQRPAWLHIPLAAVDRVLAGPSAR